MHPQLGTTVIVHTQCPNSNNVKQCKGCLPSCQAKVKVNPLALVLLPPFWCLFLYTTFMLFPFWPSISLIRKQWYVEEGSLSPSRFETCIGGMALEVNHLGDNSRHCPFARHDAPLLDTLAIGAEICIWQFSTQALANSA